MRILLLGPYPPPHGGVQTHVMALKRFLAARGVTCQFINLTRFRRPSTDGVFYPRTALGVLWLLLRTRYDIVHLHIGGDLTRRNLGLGIVCSLLPWAKAVLTFHSGGYPSSPRGRTAKPWSLQGLALRRFDCAIAVNREISDFFERIGIPPDRIRLISPSGVFADEIESVLQADREELLGPQISSFLDRHRPVLLTVGLLEPEYDLPLQIDVMATLLDRFPRAGLLVIGSGSLELPLRRHLDTKSYSHHVLICGDVPHRATLRTMAESDVLLRTTLYDGDAMSVREALHLGTPVIGTDNGMRPEGVYLIPPHESIALVGAIGDVLQSPDRLHTPRAEDTRSLALVWDTYRELLEELRAPQPGS